MRLPAPYPLQGFVPAAASSLACRLRGRILCAGPSFSESPLTCLHHLLFALSPGPVRVTVVLLLAPWHFCERVQGWRLHFAGALCRAAKKVVFDKIRSALGVVRCMVSGGGSLSMHLDDFYEVLGLPVVNGWGLSEVCIFLLRCPPLTGMSSTLLFKLHSYWGYLSTTWASAYSAYDAAISAWLASSAPSSAASMQLLLLSALTLDPDSSSNGHCQPQSPESTHLIH